MNHNKKTPNFTNFTIPIKTEEFPSFLLETRGFSEISLDKPLRRYEFPAGHRVFTAGRGPQLQARMERTRIQPESTGDGLFHS